ncbi:MAG TPA: TetR/AcrR family transcriptional regulator [Actinomycetota bacterium]|nr:TetR/AcrR family transcriptional regulator [Actinomycetota bacterium]
MSPRAPDPEMRTALIETAARLLVEHGPDALTTRRLAAEVGTSTMAVYTYFSGMDEVLGEVQKEGFRRFAALLARVEPDPADPVAEIAELGAAYFTNAVTNPHFYRFIFMEKPVDPELEVGLGTFQRLVDGVARAIDAGCFRGEPERRATQFWAGAHGVVTLYLAALLDLQEAITSFRELAYGICVGFGGDPDATAASLARGEKRFGIPAPTGATTPS